MRRIRHSGQASTLSLSSAPLRKRSGWRLIGALGMALLLAGVLPAHAAKLTERSKQKHAAEAARADLQQKLLNLKRDIDRTETARSHAADALARSESAISQANRALYELSQEQAQLNARLTQLSNEQAELAKTIADQQTHLAKLLKEQYISGDEDRIKLLLSGDNPNRINRDLQYMGYVSQAQGKLLASLQGNLQAVDKNLAETQSAKDDLDEVAQEASEQRAVLEKEKAQHVTLLSQLSSKLHSQRKEAGQIQRDDQRLAGLVDKLAKLIEEQQKAAAAQEKQRREQLARAQKARAKPGAQQEKNGRNGMNGTNGKPKNPDAIDDDVAPEKSLGRNELTPEAGVQDGASSTGFGALRGQLRLPVKGDLIAGFGSKRGDGPPRKGLFIRTAEGAEVKAVAAGRVVFADWLRGFGNLIIIDHGDQYMSIYGNNQAVLKRPGDAVKTGDVIASAGNSGGNEQSGLYFEIRHLGRAFDPQTWMSDKFAR